MLWWVNRFLGVVVRLVEMSEEFDMEKNNATLNLTGYLYRTAETTKSIITSIQMCSASHCCRIYVCLMLTWPHGLMPFNLSNSTHIQYMATATMKNPNTSSSHDISIAQTYRKTPFTLPQMSFLQMILLHTKKALLSH